MMMMMMMMMPMLMLMLLMMMMTFVKREFSPRQQMRYQQTVLNKKGFELPFKGVPRNVRCPQVNWQTGPLTEKLQSPSLVLVRGTCSWYRSADRRRERPGISDDAWQIAARYGGVMVPDRGHTCRQAELS